MENITEENITEDVIVGIDVSRDRLDVAVRPGDACFNVPRTEEGIDSLIRRLGQSSPGQSTVRLVVLEATGGFETMVAAGLAGAGL
ncbi:MAG: hypothetical protein EA405_00280, partial [Rhodospirillales bacterium]